MKKFYEVELHHITTVFVGPVDSEEEATDWAEEEVYFSRGELMEVRATELKSEVEIESSRRHADVKCIAKATGGAE